MGDTFKVTTASLNGYINDKLEPLASDIQGDTSAQEMTTWSTGTSPLLAGTTPLDAAKTVQDAFATFAKNMSDNTDGIRQQVDQLRTNLEMAKLEFDQTDDNATWTAAQLSGLLADLEVPGSTPGA